MLCSGAQSLSRNMNIRIRYIRLVTVFVATQAAIVILLSRRQELALLLFIPTIVVVPLLLFSSLKPYRFSALSAQTITMLIILLALVSNMSYFTTEINTPFEHWTRLLFPILLLLISAEIFRRSEDAINVFILFFMVTFCLSVLKTFETSAEIALQQGIERQTNWGNALAATSPFIFLIKKTLLRNTLLFVAVTTLIISLKRTGFMSAAVLVLVHFWPTLASFRFAQSISLSKIRSIVTGAVVIGGGALYLSKSEQFSFSSYLIRAELRLLKAAEDGGSGRLGLWSSAIDLFREGNFFQLIFGRGFGWFHDNYLRLKFGIQSLHNDPLEFLISFGLLGAILYTLLISRLIGLTISFRDCGAHTSFATSLVLIFVIYSFFSGTFFYVFYYTPLFVGIGYLEAQNPSRQISPRQNKAVTAR